MDVLRKTDLKEEVKVKEVVISKELATVSLNADGKILIAMDKAVFVDSIAGPEIVMSSCGGSYTHCSGGFTFKWINIKDIKSLYDKGILTDMDLNSSQVKSIQAIRA